MKSGKRLRSLFRGRKHEKSSKRYEYEATSKARAERRTDSDEDEFAETMQTFTPSSKQGGRLMKKLASYRSPKKQKSPEYLRFLQNFEIENNHGPSKTEERHVDRDEMELTKLEKLKVANKAQKLE